LLPKLLKFLSVLNYSFAANCLEHPGPLVSHEMAVVSAPGNHAKCEPKLQGKGDLSLEKLKGL
jgi:hypothetical protein